MNPLVHVALIMQQCQLNEVMLPSLWEFKLHVRLSCQVLSILVAVACLYTIGTTLLTSWWLYSMPCYARLHSGSHVSSLQDLSGCLMSIGCVCAAASQ